MAKEPSAAQLRARAQATEAASLAASSGMTLKEAWAQIKGGETPSSPKGAPASDVEERGAKTVASLKAHDEAW